MLENVRNSLRGIWSHKLRSLLTILGVIIGIASIIAIVSMSQDGWYYDASAGLPAGVPVIGQTELDRIGQLAGVEAVTAYASRQTWNAVFYLDRPLSYGTGYGIADGFFSTMQYSVARGRDFTEEEYQKGFKVALLDGNAADALFYGLPAALAALPGNLAQAAVGYAVSALLLGAGAGGGNR